jgi:hypothetical protein
MGYQPVAPVKTKRQQLESELCQLDRQIASLLDEPWRLKAAWFEGDMQSHPPRGRTPGPLDDWQRR